ncbi:LOW QUALITY PROTEIN: uncharacterized protein LOC129703196 [Leucoraja erinacea]|uniref:LOW QUALITY PROTEIN: uncharacterized protein LOC129703196 n=1 Tax=Leucoraja erinaceus TaxID=7782 RepID=UPI002458B3B2|nr:LOW QUALITY PROTEIN: uncharacterized protein LOC129703196 [Leucoraja erinacea]
MERYEAAMVLGALGNAMGYYNVTGHGCNKAGFKLTESDLSAEIDIMVFKPFQWRAPFDTLMHMATAEALVCGCDSMQEFCTQAAKRYLLALHTYQKCSLQPVSDGAQVRKKAYSSKRYTSVNRKEPKFGAAARTMCIGMCYSKAEQLNDLLQASIECGQMTHSYPAGFLGTFSTAVFSSFAIQGKPIAEWGRRMMELMPTVEKYCERKMQHFSDFRENFFSFETNWQFYLQQRGIEKDGSDKAIFPKTYNIEEQNKLFRHWCSESTGKDKGLETTLIAYDALLFAGSDWKKMCYSAMFHRGESDATGAIAGCLYGILYGFDNVPTSLYKNLEFKGHLELLGRQLYHIAIADRSLCLSADHNPRNESTDVHQIARMFVNKRTADEINNLINYIAHLEKVKETSTEKSVRLTNIFVTTPPNTKAKTGVKPRPTKFQLLQSRFTKIGFQDKLEKLALPESKTNRISKRSNTPADSQNGAVSFTTVGKGDACFTKMQNLMDLLAEQKCESAKIPKVDGSLGKPMSTNDVTAGCHTAPQPHTTNPELSTGDKGCIDLTTMHKTIDLVIQRQCEPIKNEDATLKQTHIKNGTTDLYSNTAQSSGKHPIDTKESNDTYSEPVGERDMHMRLDSPNHHKHMTSPEPSGQTVAEVLYPNTGIQVDHQTKCKLTESITSDVDEHSGQNVHFVPSRNQKLPSQEIMTNSSLSISGKNPSIITNIQENKFQTIRYNERTRPPPGRESNTPIVIDFPNIITSDGQHCLLQVIEDILSIKNNTEENPQQRVTESIEETTKSLTSSPQLVSDTSKTQTLKDTLQKQKSTFTNGPLTLPNDKQHEINQDDQWCTYMLSQPNELVNGVKYHDVMTKEHSPRTDTKLVKNTISQMKHVNPFVNLSENQSVDETTQNSEPAPRIPFPHNELLGIDDDDTRKKCTGELVITATHRTHVLQGQYLQVQKVNSEETGKPQTRSLQLFTDPHEEQKLKRIEPNSESGSSNKIQTLPETQSTEKKKDNQCRNIPCQSSDLGYTVVPLRVGQEHQPSETLSEIAPATTLQTANPESLL